MSIISREKESKRERGKRETLNLLFLGCHTLSYRIFEYSVSVHSFFLSVYLFIFERKRENTSRGGTERERERERQKDRQTESEAGSRLSAVSTEPNTGPQLTNCEIMTWAEVGLSTLWATQAPVLCTVFKLDRGAPEWLSRLSILSETGGGEAQSSLLPLKIRM